MSTRYAKTTKGREEITNRTVKLPRPARNLLLIIDNTKPAQQWATLIQGATDTDIDSLFNTGLIEPAQVEAAERERPKAPLRTVEAAIATLTYDQVYNLLTSQAKERLGLVKGFMFVLEVEKCANEAELRALAVRFVGMVRDAQGDSAAKMMRMALGVET